MPDDNRAEQAACMAHLQAENQALRAELEETNQGVLALYAELDTQAEQLRQASDLKSRFLSYMSHEFRTPLGSILSITSLLADEVDGPLSKEQQLQVAFVSNATRELSDMVDDLLDLAKIEAGRITISPAWFDMLDLFAALRGMFRPIVDMGSVDLIFEEPHGLPKMYTDDKKLAQILRNFISNALKFTTRGEVRVSAHLQGNDQIRFAVTDTGIGIAPELLGGLFEDFAQIDSPLQKRLRGTGLGLSLCKRFAALLGGEVGVDSVPGEGSSFFVVIPLALAQESVDEP
ncbi:MULTISPECIES: ATP-binding protein [Pseudomonas]|jgi:signal transduction histidine kinase|uniref:sensor histidine kinase n=1 Tax=Pseudomonas TaxID=286 RepID=UPI000401B5E7|nr:MULTISPECIES: ATP-binding protein [Pseudomonas]ATP50695.1 histidine kinase [Pseudomonas putida]USS53893.1 ATP-binding protein [Pseudomonas kermanshahensis]UVL64728.1 histidine kinase [Pseudomonas sp. B21-031]SMF48123.1 His Kinase A (phospho-acceptor) domain-containing protein [Pseudomonas sp. LAIL14HWK12:I11]SMR73858.1 His Kinase A (phospho-acceptor) domain-containing protein [Pseudomonas sp. LAIL14HWK12:I10]